MSDFATKCENVLLGGSTGAAAGGSIGAACSAIGSLALGTTTCLVGGPLLAVAAAVSASTLGATIGGGLGSLAGLFFD